MFPLTFLWPQPTFCRGRRTPSTPCTDHWAGLLLSLQTVPSPARFRFSYFPNLFCPCSVPTSFSPPLPGCRDTMLAASGYLLGVFSKDGSRPGALDTSPFLGIPSRGVSSPDTSLHDRVVHPGVSNHHAGAPTSACWMAGVCPGSLDPAVLPEPAQTLNSYFALPAPSRFPDPVAGTSSPAPILGVVPDPVSLRVRSQPPAASPSPCHHFASVSVPDLSRLLSPPPF